MDEFIKKIIENKDNLKNLYLQPSLTIVNSNNLSDFPNRFITYGGKSFLPYSYYLLMKYEVNAVLWSKEGSAEGAICYGYANTIYPLQNKNFDAISFSFGGCSMARFTMNGAHYIAHIQSSVSFNEDRRMEWVNFVKNNPAITINAMFRPNCDSNLLSQNRDIQLWGVITKEMNCYSVYVLCYDSKNKRTTPSYNCERIELYAIERRYHIRNYAPTVCFLKNQIDWTQGDFEGRKSAWNTFFTGTTQEIWKR
jgi:hypothetical protein